MSEQKYYVFQKSLVGKKIVSQLVRYKLTSEDAKFVSVSRNKSGRYENRFSEFTKSELAKIMDGALYKRAPYGEIFETGSRTGWYHVEDDDSWDDEWINPLIELVPVEGN